MRVVAEKDALTLEAKFEPVVIAKLVLACKVCELWTGEHAFKVCGPSERYLSGFETVVL